MSETGRNLTRRTLDVLEVLCSYAVSGASNSELAEAAQTSASNVTRCMAQLIDKGWARKSEDTGRFYPAPEFTRLVFRVEADFNQAVSRLDDARRNLTGRM